MSKQGADKPDPVDEAGFVDFLETETSAVISGSTIASDWSGLEALEVEQGNEAFESPPLQSHFLALCTHGFGLADISFDALKDPRRSIVEPGTLCFLPAGQSATFEMAGRATSTHVLVQPEVLSCVAERRSNRAFSPMDLEGFSGRHHMAMRETVQSIQSGAQWRSAVWADTMGLQLASQLYDFVSVPDTREGTGIDLSDLQFGRAVDFIEAHLTRDFTLEDMARAVDVGVYRLAKGFAAETGCSIESYRNERRIGIVQAWLHASGKKMSNEALARQVGYKSVAELDAAFRAQTGVSLVNYRAGKLT
ncbi:AraC family transcriptional regulator [uncultured Tateyamaria sp.]|uniref:helix-turn-helix domain-containing protein n=1 Tax=uncultured Tateyamaria sp. TaxID=455651 RepID=UPI00260587DA|nr:AraC family transcriptional regulator [uncultured Tateyamaria sp.]